MMIMIMMTYEQDDDDLGECEVMGEGVMNYPICQQWQTLAVPGTPHFSSLYE